MAIQRGIPLNYSDKICKCAKTLRQKFGYLNNVESPGVLSMWPDRGSSRFEGFTEWLANDAICQPNTTNWRYS